MKKIRTVYGPKPRPKKPACKYRVRKTRRSEFTSDQLVLVISQFMSSLSTVMPPSIVRDAATFVVCSDDIWDFMSAVFPHSSKALNDPNLIPRNPMGMAKVAQKVMADTVKSMGKSKVKKPPKRKR